MKSETEILGFQVTTLERKQLLEACESMIAERGHHVIGLNAAKVLSARKDDFLSEIIMHSSMVHADGISVVWAGRFLGSGKIERYAGIDLMFDLLVLCRKLNLGVFLLGAKPSVLETVNEALTKSGVRIVGYRDGYWAREEELKLVQEIASTKPDILLVAIPSPDKEFFVSRNLSKLNCGLILGVGGSFDVVAGVTKRAPLWLQKLGFEWFYRFIQEPKRMFRRYFVGNTIFISVVLSEKFKQLFRGNVDTGKS